MKTTLHISAGILAFTGIICLTACSASEAEAAETSHNTAKTSKSETAPEMEGLFGIKFGKVMPKSEPCATNNVGELAYEFQPETLFRGYSDYVLFATPITRQVSQIRAICRIDSDEADDEVEATVKRLEAKFNKKALKLGDTRFIRFSNGDLIVVEKEDSLMRTTIKIDASCDRLRELTKTEVATAESARFAKDRKSLAILPEKEAGETKVFQLASVFGITFGEECKKGFNPTKNNAGAWAYNYNPDSSFMDCEDFVVFATAKTKKVFMVRAVYDGDDEGEATRHYEQIKRLVENVTGREFRDSEEKGRDKGCSMQFGDVLITLEKDWLRDNVTLDFVRINLYRQNEREHEEEQSEGMSEDLDAL